MKQVLGKIWVNFLDVLWVGKTFLMMSQNPKEKVCKLGYLKINLYNPCTQKERKKMQNKLFDNDNLRKKYL